jgi:hypothetical protein
MVSLLPTKFHEILFCRGVALTNCVTDRTKTICLPTKVGGDIKTPQLTKDQRYDKLKRKRTFQTLWKEKIPWVEASGWLITSVI